MTATNAGAAQTPDTALPVREVAAALSEIIGGLPPLWIEGEITKASPHRATFSTYLTLRDPDVDMVLDVRCKLSLWEGINPPLAEGARVVLYAKPSYYEKGGRLTWFATAIQAVGVGDKLAQLEALKQQLRAEGLFDPSNKKELPFLPHHIGLITGAKSDAEADFLKVSRHRWPAVQISVTNTAVQGPRTAPEVIAALQAFDRDDDIDVIVITRGGGAMEDVVFPFSEESLVRAVAAARTPVVVAIGHEQDIPLVDFAADVRASTPSNAAELVVPDVTAELDALDEARARIRAAVVRVFALRVDEVHALRDRARTSVRHRLERGHDEIASLRARARSLSPLATLQRGYAIAQDESGNLVTSIGAVKDKQALSIRVADGRIHTTVDHTEPLAGAN